MGGIKHDLEGCKFGHLTVQRFAGLFNHQAHWVCLCECGKTVTIPRMDLIHKRKSCGCFRGEGHCTHRSSKTPEYRVWSLAKTRCYNASRKFYPRYGGRGIIMCDRWKNNFANFLEDMGKRPSKRHTLDRINNDGNYEPSNCRWATQKEQANNKKHGRALRKLTDEQVEEIKTKLPLSHSGHKALAVIYGVSYMAIRDIQKGRTWKEYNRNAS